MLRRNVPVIKSVSSNNASPVQHWQTFGVNSRMPWGALQNFAVYLVSEARMMELADSKESSNAQITGVNTAKYKTQLRTTHC